MSKKLKIVLLCAVWLIGCRYIGQYRKAQKTVENSIRSTESTDIASTEQIETAFNFVGGEIKNSKDTSDNPWGKTAGIIDMDDVGKVVFLTPETEYDLDVSDLENLIFSYQIHPWVKEASNGAGIKIELLNENGDIINEQEIAVNSSDDWKKVDIECKDAEKINISCVAGKDNDASGDWVVLSNELSVRVVSSNFGKDGYVKSATYFGEEWPINFWNSELETLDDDFKRIRADGFNSIIIVIPWREFQPSVNPISYNEYAFDNLEKVLKVAQENELDVYARIGYTWDYFNDQKESISERYIDILQNKQTKKAWLAYCKKMHESLSKYDCFKDGFLTWEDFWGCTSICDNEDEAFRREYAKEIGYQKWIKEKYKLSYNEEFGTKYDSIEQIPIPKRNEPAMEAFYSFYDDFLNELLDETQKNFSNISLEVRMDEDPVQNKDGETVAYSHKKTYMCEQSDYTATMYGIPMGFENNGERVSAEDAIEHTDYILSKLNTSNGGKPVYVEQFLYADNTPQFSYNAQIKDDELNDYIQNVYRQLLNHTKGYGIWTYRDYKNNMIYNPQFALGENGWVIDDKGEISFSNEKNTYVCKLECGGSIQQEVSAIRNHFPQEKYIVDINVLEGDGEIQISVGDKQKTINVEHLGKYEIEFPVGDTFDLSFKCVNGEVVIDDLCLYSFISKGHLYDTDNSEEECIESIRILNKKLQ